jgi:hypothetical protein
VTSAISTSTNASAIHSLATQSDEQLAAIVAAAPHALPNDPTVADHVRIADGKAARAEMFKRATTAGLGKAVDIIDGWRA